MQLTHHLVSQSEMADWPTDRSRTEQKRWAETTWKQPSDKPHLFNCNTWPGRIVLQVSQPAQTIRTEAVWRRSALSIRARGLKLLHAATKAEVKNAKIITFDQERVVLHFCPEQGAGTYHLYYGAMEDWLFDPSDEWLALADSPDAVVHAEHVEARCTLDRFDEMEQIALSGEIDDLLARYPEAGYIVFPEDRDHPIMLSDEIPVHWALDGPREEIVLPADRGEYRVFQVGVWACRSSISDIHAEMGDFCNSKNQTAIPVESSICLTLESRTKHLWMGRPTGPFPIPKGKVKALWFSIDIPGNIAAGEYSGKVKILPQGCRPTEVQVRLVVSDNVVSGKGDHDLWRLSRLRWLESNIGLDGAIHLPFKALRLDPGRRSVRTWGHTIRINDLGLPEQIVVGETEILGQPLHLQGNLDGRALSWESVDYAVTSQAADHVAWRGRSRCDELKLVVDGRIEFDGCTILQIRVESDAAVTVDALRMCLQWKSNHAKLASGLGYAGRREGERAAPQGTSLWMGSLEAGVLWLTESLEPWDDPDRPDATMVLEQQETVTLIANFGRHKVEPDQPWHIRIILLPTPLRPFDPRHWDFRYCHLGGGFEPGDSDTPQSFLKDNGKRLDELKALGVKRLNLHDWWGPAFNYPWQWEREDNLSKLTEEAHKRGIFLKVYNSGRELSALAPEFRALVEEAHRGEGGAVCDPHLVNARFQDAWHHNHLPDSFAQGWPRISYPYGNEHSVVVGNAHRYGNFYLESIRYMTEFFGTDGAYWDGADFPFPSQNLTAGFGYRDSDDRIRPQNTHLAIRELAKRMWSMLRAINPNAVIDSHHGWDKTGSAMSNHLLFMPFIDSIWHGEGFSEEYGTMDPWWWLVEVAGLPFGIPSEMLGGETYLERGMLFGIWPRSGWCAGMERQAKLWRFFDTFGIKDATMHGWWEEKQLVLLNCPSTYCTVYLNPNSGVLMAIASWHPETPEWTGKRLDVSLFFERTKLGLSPDGELHATDILTDEIIDIEAPIPLPGPGKGRLIWLRCAKPSEIRER